MITDRTTLVEVDWNEFDNGVDYLCSQLCSNDFDVVLCIPTGGLVLGKVISEKLGLPFGTFSFDSDADECDNIRLFHNTDSMRRILLVDDITDSGETFKRALKALSNYESVNTCSFTLNEHSCFKPDYHCMDVNSNVWVKFPWENGGREHLNVRGV